MVFFGFAALGLEFVETGEGFFEHVREAGFGAADLIEHAGVADGVEVGLAGAVGVAEILGNDVVEVVVMAGVFEVDVDSFEAADTDEAPAGGDYGVDEGDFGGGDGAVFGVELVGERAKGIGALAAEADGAGEGTVTDAVEGAAGFAFGRAGASGFLGVEAVGL